MRWPCCSRLIPKSGSSRPSRPRPSIRAALPACRPMWLQPSRERHRAPQSLAAQGCACQPACGFSLCAGCCPEPGEEDEGYAMNETQKDVYALAWLLGVSLLLAWLILLAESGLRKWRVLIQQETAHQAAQAALLSHAVSLSRPEDWVSGNRGPVAAGAAGAPGLGSMPGMEGYTSAGLGKSAPACMPAYMTVNYEDIELRILAGMTEQEVAEMLARPRPRERHLCNMGPEELARARAREM